MRVIVDNKIPFIKEAIEKIADSVIYTPGRDFTPELVKDVQITRQGCTPLLLMGLVFFFSGLGFKISLVPFHFWTADTYQGAPTTVTGYLSVISKGANCRLRTVQSEYNGTRRPQRRGIRLYYRKRKPDYVHQEPEPFQYVLELLQPRFPGKPLFPSDER